MSVLIKGMDMPNSCDACHLRGFIDHDGDILCRPTKQWCRYYENMRPDFCPLIEVEQGEWTSGDSCPFCGGYIPTDSGGHFNYYLGADTKEEQG